MHFHEILYPTNACNKCLNKSVFPSNITFGLIRIIFVDTCSILLLNLWFYSTKFSSISIITDFHPSQSGRFPVGFFVDIQLLLFTHSAIRLWSTLNFKESKLIEFSLANFLSNCLVKLHCVGFCLWSLMGRKFSSRVIQDFRFFKEEHNFCFCLLYNLRKIDFSHLNIRCTTHCRVKSYIFAWAILWNNSFLNSVYFRVLL